MDGFLQILLLFLLTTGLLFFCILLLKKILHKKLSPTLHLLLWFLLIAKLFFPVGVPSQFSPWNYLPVRQAPGLGFNNMADSFEYFFVIIWIAGIAAMIVWYMAGYVRISRLSAASAVVNAGAPVQILGKYKAAYGIRQKIDLLCCPDVTEPYLTGLFRIRLLLPAKIIDNDRLLDYVLAHELAHLKRKDNWLNLLLNLLNIFYWFNPFVWMAFSLIRKDMEACCDQKTLCILGVDKREEYIRSILSFNCMTEAPRFSVELAFASPLRKMQERVISMFYTGKTGIPAKALVLFFVAILVVVCFTSAYTPGQEKNKSEETAAGQPAPLPPKEETPVLASAVTTPQPSAETAIAALSSPVPKAVTVGAIPTAEATRSPHTGSVAESPIDNSTETAVGTQPPSQTKYDFEPNPEEPTDTNSPEPTESRLPAPDPTPSPTPMPEPEPPATPNPTGAPQPTETPKPPIPEPVQGTLSVVFEWHVSRNEAKNILAHYGVTVEVFISDGPPLVCDGTWDDTSITSQKMMKRLQADPNISEVSYVYQMSTH